jgi:hypothetical protein
MSTPQYTFDYISTPSESVVPANLNRVVYWYDSGEKGPGASNFPIYYDPEKNYNLFYTESLGSWVIREFGNLDYPPLNTSFTSNDGAGSITSTYSPTGLSGWAGLLEVSGPTVSDAWYRAETEAFNSLSSFLGCTENDNCFRGFLPIMGDSTDLKYVDVWQMASGGSGTFDVERLAGTPGNWCSLRTDLRIDSLWKTREQAMNFSGAVLAWLRSTGNLGQTGNVTWAMLTSIPDEPEEYLTQGQNRQRFWRQEIELELVYLTGSVYS